MSETNGSDKPLRLAVLISGGGRTMVNIAECIGRGELNAEIVAVIGSRAGISGLDRAAEFGVESHVVSRKDFDSVEAFSEAVWALIRPAGADLVCLAGYLSLLLIPEDFEGRVINIHPALLPKYGGQGMYGHHVHEAVIAAGEAESGCTVHYATNEYDKGPIICQKSCPVLEGDTPDDLAARVFEQEILAYPEAIRIVEAQLRGAGS
ncbi:MAG: phosphoribosylglycinamide formyltransferase [Planctomycetota bacterium]|jgi:formyltetrahydrofolate-dependent phosphoribosylglycinamide formyltransferase